MSNVQSKNNYRFLFTGVVVITLVALGGALHFSQQVFAEAEQDATPIEQSAPPPQTVEVIVMTPSEIRVWQEYSGRLQAVERVEIKPQVSGTITEVHFHDGSQVKQGDLLFVIDQRPYQAALDRAKAALQEAKSNVSLTRSEFKRAKQLIKNKSVSKSQFDIAQSAYQAATAKVAAAKAELFQAELDYEYAHIRAPITGRIDRAEMTVGNLVQAGPSAPTLTSIVSTQQIYAAFDVDERTYLSSVRRQHDNELPVELRLSGGDKTAYRGTIHSFANQMDSNTGTIRARALLNNADGALLPGMFANIRLGSADKSSLLLVDERAVGTNQDQKYVYVISADNEVVYREVKLGQSVNGQRVVISGLESGEQVMINSLLRVQPGTKVQAKIITDSTNVQAKVTHK